MGLRDRRARRSEERETFGRGEDARRYRLRQKMLSIGDDFWIEDEEGERVFRVDGKALRLRQTFHLEDLQGTCARSRSGSCTSATPWRSKVRRALGWRWCTRR
jgi:LURP-one-related